METRKIQTVGGGTYTVSVPKEWAREQGLETGEPVRLATHRDGSLIVRGGEAAGGTLRSVTVPIEDRTVASVERAIRATYEGGFERIELLAEGSFTDEQERAARTLARRLVGTEIAEADATEIVGRVLLDASAVSIRQSIDQAVSIVDSMLWTIIDALTDGERAAEHVRDRRPEVERLAALVRRHHTRSLCSLAELDALGIDRVPLSRYDRTADRIDRIAATTVRLAEAVDDAALGDDRRRALAERTRELQSALESATNRVLERSDATSVPVTKTSANGFPVSETLPDGGDSDPSLLGIVDALRQIGEHVRTIEHVGMETALHRTATSQAEP